MSNWQDKIDNIKFTITTGDAKQFTPLWKGASKSTGLSTTAFDFIDVAGSFIERKERMGSKFPLTFWFDGGDNIEQANAFESSAFDKRAWTVTHPYYGTIKGQPISIERNDDNFNITAFTVEFLESIDVDYPNANFSVKDNTLLKKDAILQSSGTSFATADVVESEDIVKIKDANVQTAGVFKNLQTDATYADYQNSFATAQKAVDKLLSDSFTAITKTQALLNDVATYESPVLERLNAYVNAFNKIGNQLETLADKYFYETQGATAISSYANAAVNPIEGDYEIAPDVEQASAGLIEIYNNYLTVIDGAAVSIYDVEDAWQPDATVQSQLNDLVMYTIANLYQTAFESQQERIVYTDKDTNIILLTHRYLGLDASDVNIDRFRIINGIKLNELFKIKKGRQIRYYV